MLTRPASARKFAFSPGVSPAGKVIVAYEPEYSPAPLYTKLPLPSGRYWSSWLRGQLVAEVSDELYVANVFPWNDTGELRGYSIALITCSGVPE